MITIRPAAEKDHSSLFALVAHIRNFNPEEIELAREVIGDALDSEKNGSMWTPRQPPATPRPAPSTSGTATRWRASFLTSTAPGMTRSFTSRISNLFHIRISANLISSRRDEPPPERLRTKLATLNEHNTAAARVQTSAALVVRKNS